MTAAEVMDVIARLPYCAGHAADAVSAYTHLLASCGKDNWRRFQLDLDGKTYRIVNVSLFIGNKECSRWNTWMTSKELERSSNGSHVEEIDENAELD